MAWLFIGDSEFEAGNSETRPFIYKDFQIFDIEDSIKSAYYNNLQLNSIFNNKVNVINYNLNQDCNNYVGNNSCIGFYSRYASLNKSKIDNSNIGTNLFLDIKLINIYHLISIWIKLLPAICQVTLLYIIIYQLSPLL